MDLIDTGTKLKHARRAAGLSQTELAERANVSRARIDAIENGRAPEVGLKLLLRLLHTLGLDLRLVTFNNNRPTLEDLREDRFDRSGGGA